MSRTSSNTSASSSAQTTFIPESTTSRETRARAIYDELVSDLRLNLPEAKKARASIRNYKGVQITKYEAIGRMIPRIVDAHAPIIKVITDGLVRDGVWDPAPEDDTEEAISGERENELSGPQCLSRKELNLGAYDLLLELTPHFKDILYLMASNEDDINCFAKVLKKEFLRVQSDDRTKVRKELFDIIQMCGYHEHTVQRPRCKRERGIKNPFTGLLICPLKFLDQWTNEYDEFIEEHDSGAVKLKAFDYPVFCYPPGRAYNKDDIDKDLFRSEFLVRIWKHIFMGTGIPESRMRNSSKPTVAALGGLTTVTGRSIAYAACQARFSLSPAMEYAYKDVHFNYEDFYYCIVSWFEEFPDDQVILDTLDWWKKQAWPNGIVENPSKKRPNPAYDDGSDCDVAISREARRKRKEARLAQETNVTSS